MDPMYITCSYHIYISLGLHAVCLGDKSEIAVIGLGGGALSMFLRKYLPQSTVTAVDIDPAILSVAVEWFGLQQNEKLIVKIEDGLNFIKNAASNGLYSVVLLKTFGDVNMLLSGYFPHRIFLLCE